MCPNAKLQRRGRIMGGDTVVALGEATGEGCTHFGHNSTRPERQFQPLSFTPRCTHAADQAGGLPGVQLAPARQVFSVLGGQAAGGRGYEYGLNEHQVAVSGVALPGRTPVETGLIGPQLVRLTLERSASA